MNLTPLFYNEQTWDFYSAASVTTTLKKKLKDNPFALNFFHTGNRPVLILKLEDGREVYENSYGDGTRVLLDRLTGEVHELIEDMNSGWHIKNLPNEIQLYLQVAERLPGGKNQTIDDAILARFTVRQDRHARPDIDDLYRLYVLSGCPTSQVELVRDMEKYPMMYEDCRS